MFEQLEMIRDTLVRSLDAIGGGGESDYCSMSGYARENDQAGNAPPYLQKLIPQPTDDFLMPVYDPGTGEYVDPPAAYASDGGPTDDSRFSHGNGPGGFGGASEYGNNNDIENIRRWADRMWRLGHNPDESLKSMGHDLEHVYGPEVMAARRRNAGSVTDEFGREYPPQMPTPRYSAYAEQIPWDGPDPTEGRDPDFEGRDYNFGNLDGTKWHNTWGHVNDQGRQHPVSRSFQTRGGRLVGSPRPTPPGGPSYSAYAHEGYPGPQFPPDYATASPEHHEAAISWLSGMPLKELHRRHGLLQQQMPATNDPRDESNWHVMNQHLMNAIQRQQFPEDFSAYGDQPSSHMDMTSHKAREILHDGTVHGHPLTKKQRGLFGSIVGRTDNAAYAGFPVEGQTHDRMFGLPVMTMPSDRSRLVEGFNPHAHIVNQPRRSGTLTDDAQRRLVAAFNPSGSYSGYGVYERFNPSLGYQERPDDGDARGGNPQAFYADRTYHENEMLRGLSRRGQRIPDNAEALVSVGRENEEHRAEMARRRAEARAGQQGHDTHFSLYAEHGYPEFSPVQHGTPRGPFERPGFLPTSLRNPTTGTGSFHTGHTGDRIVGQPQPSVKQPHIHRPMGFYDEDASMYGDHGMLWDWDEFPEGPDAPPDMANLHPGWNRVRPSTQRRWIQQEDENNRSRFNQERQDRIRGGLGGYSQYAEPWTTHDWRKETPMHGPGSNTYLITDTQEDYDPEYSPLGNTSTPRTFHPDNGKEWESWLAHGGMGNYSQYDDSDHWGFDEFGRPAYGPGPHAHPMSPADIEESWEEEPSHRWLNAPYEPPPLPGTHTDPFGRQYPPQMPGGYAAYAEDEGYVYKPYWTAEDEREHRAHERRKQENARKKAFRSAKGDPFKPTSAHDGGYQGRADKYAAYDDEHYTPEQTGAHNRQVDAELRQRLGMPPRQIVRSDGSLTRVSVPDDEPEYNPGYPYAAYGSNVVGEGYWEDRRKGVMSIPPDYFTPRENNQVRRSSQGDRARHRRVTRENERETGQQEHDTHYEGDDMMGSLSYMHGKLSALLPPTPYDESESDASSGDDYGIDQPDRDYWRKKTPYNYDGRTLDELGAEGAAALAAAGLPPEPVFGKYPGHLTPQQIAQNQAASTRLTEEDMARRRRGESRERNTRRPHLWPWERGV